MGKTHSSTYIEVDDFREQSTDNEHQEHPEEPVLILGSASAPSDDGGTEALRADDTESTHPDANAAINQHVLISPSWTCVKRSCNGTDYDDSNV